MKIKKYGTEQFAGIRDREVAFTDGMNVILGDNEAGKSTVIAGIYHTLFQPADPKKSSSEYKTFEELYKPAGTQLSEGLYVDGCVELNIGDELVKVEKSWFSDPDTRVRIDGTGYKSKGAEKKLAELLKYGPVFYNHIVFGRQSNEETVLQWIFDAAAMDGKTDIKHKMDEIGSVIGGIDTEKLQAALMKKMDALSGRWDFDLQAPAKERGRTKDISDPWKNGVGDILAAYYEWKQAERLLENVNTKIERIQRLDEKLQNLENEQKDMQDKLDYIAANRGNIQNRRANEELLERVTAELKIMKQRKDTWPLLLEDRERAMMLQQQETESNARRAKEILCRRIREIEQLQEECARYQEADRENLEADCEKAQSLMEAVRLAESLLSAGRFTAHVKARKDHTIQVDGADTSQLVEGEEILQLNGFVKINIPDVAEITVDTQGTDGDKVKKELLENRHTLEKLFETYQVQNMPSLLQQKKEADAKVQKLHALEQTISIKLDGERLTDLQEQAEQMEVHPNQDIPENLEEQVRELEQSLGVVSLDAAKAVCEQRLESYKKEYTGLRELISRIEDSEAAKQKYEERLAGLPDLTDLETLEAQEDALKQKVEETQQNTKEGIREKGALETEISCTDQDEVQDRAEAARETFQNNVEQYKIYARILEDLQEIKDTMQSSPIDPLKEKIAEYLGEISGDRLTLGGMDEKLDMELLSGERPLPTCKILSEGTKKTILLAFRLAVLDFFFQDEGGMIVLDDVLLDMDPGRRANSIQLLTSFAQNNQVIFTTCDPQIAKQLGGTQIKLV